MPTKKKQPFVVEQQQERAFLRQAAIPQIEGNRIRLHVAKKVFGGRPGAEHGASWLDLSPSDDADSHDEQVMVRLPLNQSEALAEACAAFNRIMDAHERRAAFRDHL